MQSDLTSEALERLRQAITLQVGKLAYLVIIDRDEKIQAEGFATVLRADITIDKERFGLGEDPERPDTKLAVYQPTAAIEVQFETLHVRELTRETKPEVKP